MRFIHGLELREMPCFKGFDGLSILFDKKVLSYCRILLAMLSPIARLLSLLVAAPNQTKQKMKTVEYHLARAMRLARLPQSKNVARLRTANHRAMGEARRNELAKLAIA